MTLASNAFTSYSAVGNRDDLDDAIYNVAPTNTPFLQAVEWVDAKAVLHEWQRDTLAAAAQNAQLEGDVVAAAAATATVRLSNTAQIAYKSPRVTGTQEAVQKAGRTSEMALQVAKRAKELKRDMENDLLANNAEVSGDSTTARELGGLPTWFTTNDSYGTGGAEGGLGNTAVTEGTQRDFTETLLKTTLRQCFNSGGEPDCIMLNATNKQVFSTFTGNATRTIDATKSELRSNVDVYHSDFGTLEVKANRFMYTRMIAVLQMDMWAVAMLRPFQLSDLAKTGDSIHKLLLIEYTLESREEAASGAIFDVNT